jgi:1,4-alpha-glucan branching enzyme
MDFVLALHSHLPWMLNHGRWPHGSDWLCEAALDTYLPLIEELRRLEAQDIPAPVTLGVTPVLANQLVHPAFQSEMAFFLEERLGAARRAPAELAATGDDALVPLAGWWRARLERMGDLLATLGGDIVGELRRLENAERLEIISSAATHGYLPLLGRDESIRFQLLVGRREHERLFGRAPRGCWVPECAYRAQGPWSPLPAARARERVGVDHHLAAAGFQYFFVDAHLAAAGQPLGAYADVPLGAERFDADPHDPEGTAGGGTRGAAARTPYSAYVITPPGAPGVYALVRDPRSSMQVWSRHQGYPGDEWYLEFHKIRWPGGLKLWRVTGPNVDLGGKGGYDVARAAERAGSHADHFAHLLGGIASDAGPAGEVVVAPFDTELFGHWWFEGVHFLGEMYRRLARSNGRVRPVTAGQHLRGRRAAPRIRLAEGSWGAHGDHHMWLNPATEWTWHRMWALEDAFWTVVPQRLPEAWARPLLASAARQLLLAQASDWQFIISTGAAADYAERRFTRHADDLAALLAGLAPGAAPADREAAARLAAGIAPRDDLFPDVLGALEAAARPA